MKLTYKGFQLSVLLMLAASCSTNRGTTTGTATKTTYSEEGFKKIIAGDDQKTWKIGEASKNGTKVILSECDKQAKTIYKPDYSMQDIYPEGMDCLPSSAGSWTFNPSKNEITVTSPGETTTGTLISATDSRITIMIINEDGKMEITFIPAD